MSSTQNIKRMINSAENLKSIVGTMKAYASSNIVQFQTAAKASMEYSEIVDMSLFVVLSDQSETKKDSNKDKDKDKGFLYIIFGSDHGLAGRFNENISVFAEDIITSDTVNSKIIVVGQQVYSRLEHTKRITNSYTGPQSVEAITESVLDLLFKIEEYREETREIIMIYNMPEEHSSFKVKKESLYPVDFNEITKRVATWDSNSLPVILIDKELILSELLKQYFFITLYKTFCYSLAAENASRLASMQSAEKNIEERLEGLLSDFRRKRQNDITEEINDVISGFKAIRKNKMEEDQT